MTVASGIQRVISAGAQTQRISDKGQQHLPGDETWLIGEQRASGKKKYYLASQPRRDEPAYSSCHHQGTMDLRAGARQRAESAQSE